MEIIFNYLQRYIVNADYISLNHGSVNNLVIGKKYLKITQSININYIEINICGIYHHEDYQTYYFQNFIDNTLLGHNFINNYNNEYYYYQLSDDFILSYIEDIFLTFYHTSNNNNNLNNIYISKNHNIIIIHNCATYGIKYSPIQNNRNVFKNKYYNLYLTNINVN